MKNKFGKTVRVDSIFLYNKIAESYKSVYSFCKQKDISYQTVINLINGTSQSTKATTLIKIASALECPISKLILRKEIKNNVQDFLDHVRI